MDVTDRLHRIAGILTGPSWVGYRTVHQRGTRPAKVGMPKVASAEAAVTDQLRAVVGKI